MCGIAGIIALKANLPDQIRELIAPMTKCLHHRGPDATNYFHHQQFCYGNTRLAVMDPSAHGSLPFSTPNKDLVLCFNGEISNFEELASNFKLREKYPFISHSDAEVLIYLYKELGIDCLKHLSGMFSFALYDQLRNKIYIVRDFFGLTPLFYSCCDQKIFFASEIKALLQNSSLDRTLNQEAFFHLLSLGYMPKQHTPYQQIHELQGGEYLAIDLASGDWSRKSYYQLSFTSNPIYSSDTMAIATTRELLIDSVERSLKADAPLGLTLSGGIDSSAILGICKMLGKSKGINTYGLRISDGSFDESRYQRLMAEYGQTNHHEIVVDCATVMNHLQEHMAFIDEPYGHGAALPSFLLARAAKGQVKVLLSGEGGDEIFNAYDTYGAYKWRKLYRRLTPSLMRKLMRVSSNFLPTSHKKLSLDFKLKRFFAGSELSVPASHLYWRHLLTDEDKRRVMPSFENASPTSSLFEEEFLRCDIENELDKLSNIDITHFFIGDLMVKNDRMFMANSIESRFPFMDRLLVEHVTSIPSAIRMPGLERRTLQKKALVGLVPDSILRRQSFGLEMPYSRWLNRELAPLCQQFFCEASKEKLPFFNWVEIHRIWQEHRDMKKDHGRFLWGMLLTMTWHQQFVETSDYKRYLT